MQQLTEARQESMIAPIRSTARRSRLAIGIRTRLRSQSAARQRGMTLIEILVVVLIFAFIIGLVFVNLEAMYQKYRLDNGAADFKSFYEAVPAMARSQNRDVFVSWDGTNRALIASTDQAATQVLERTTVPGFLVISPAPTAMRCDTMGRAYVGSSTTMMGAVATTSITHQKMVDGYLSPNIVFQVSLTPLWHIRMQKVVQ